LDLQSREAVSGPQGMEDVRRRRTEEDEGTIVTRLAQVVAESPLNDDDSRLGLLTRSGGIEGGEGQQMAEQGD
jgi:hypothetical protein